MIDKPDEAKVVGDTLLYSFTVKGRAQIGRFKEWLDSHTNESKPMWVPTLQDDFAPLDLPRGNKISVRPKTPLTGRRDLMFIYADGARYARLIQLAEPRADGRLELALHEPLPPEPGIRQICYLWMCRPDYSNTPIEWDGGDTTRVTLRFIELPSSAS